ncbi:hypothetical protein FG379_002235 [Cryptosporidium bovis]|uniref:uncharacterized protein n=1 Tax=Cryptosporidium bovis TaxID=310047 RepID=UPI00351A76C3|nr:hypothetical protein FG379_002235 [Cryptosporidium bovis]
MTRRILLFYVFSIITLSCSSLQRFVLSAECDLSPGSDVYCNLDNGNANFKRRQWNSIRGSKTGGKNVTKFLRYFFNYSSKKDKDDFSFGAKDGSAIRDYFKPIGEKIIFERGILRSTDVCSSIQLMSFWKFYSYIIKTVYFEMFNKHIDIYANNNFNFNNSDIFEFNALTDNFNTSELIDYEIRDKLTEINNITVETPKANVNFTEVNNTNLNHYFENNTFIGDYNLSFNDNGDMNKNLNETAKFIETSGSFPYSISHTYDEDGSLGNNTYKDTGKSNVNYNISYNQMVCNKTKSNKEISMFGIPVKFNYLNNESKTDVLVTQVSHKMGDLLKKYQDSSQFLTKSDGITSESADSPNKTSNVTYLQIGFQKYIIG